MIDLIFYISLFVVLVGVGCCLLRLFDSIGSTRRVYKRLDKPGWKVSGGYMDTLYYDTEKEALSSAIFWNKQLKEWDTQKNACNYKRIA